MRHQVAHGKVQFRAARVGRLDGASLIVRERVGCSVSSDPADPGAGLAKHRAEIVAAIRACDRPGLRRPGTRLAAAIWRAAGLVRDPEWWQELAAAGESLAI